MDMKRKVLPVQYKIKREISVDAENEVKKEDSKFQPMLIQRDLDVLRELGFDSREAVEISFVLHNGVPKIFKCDFTPSESYMKRHSKLHVGNNLEKDIPKRQKDENSNGNEGYGHFKCTMCGANFKRKSELDIHVTASHGGTAIY